MFKEHHCLKLDGDDHEMAECQIAEETPLSIFINGRHFVTAMISPEMVKEFIIGHLFSEKIINGLKDLESLELEENNNIARLIISNPIKALTPRRPIVSGCGGSSSYLDESKLQRVSSNLEIDKDRIFAAMKAVTSSKLHDMTGGVHTVGLFEENGEVCLSEDIGRHNAVDKVIGFGLMKGIDFSRTFVASTGRISSDMALKCSVAGIPIIASRSASTSLALAVAEKTGLTILGFVRGKRMNIYTGLDRIIGLHQ